ncbi:MAG: thiamine phosphate synthase [Deltaproteobacteria bacterium]|nr:thiamine phosphate synthase [Deltaproteobacteria bacterium]
MHSQAFTDEERLGHGAIALPRLHFITYDDAQLSHAEMAAQGCRGGVRLVQLRTKDKSLAEWLRIAQEVKATCDANAARLIVNDNVEVAKKVGAYGVHLGRSDCAVSEARRVLGHRVVIGGTANTAEDLERLIEEGADYIGVGPFRFTSTKKELSPILGIAGIGEIVRAAARRRKSVPIIAVGGIELGDLKALVDCGVYGVAVSGAIGRAASIEKSANLFAGQLSEAFV